MIRYIRKTYTINGREIVLEYEDENQDDDVFPSKSTGLTPWPSSFILSNYISRNQHLFANKNVLELGSGIGLCGISVQKYAHSTTLSDKDDQVLNLLQKNVCLNGLKEGTDVHIRKLSWGKDLDVLGSKFDIIMGSDIIYSSMSVGLVLETVNFLLSENESMFILSHVCRDVAFDRELLALADSRHFSCENIPIHAYCSDVPTVAHVPVESLRFYLFKRTIL